MVVAAHTAWIEGPAKQLVDWHSQCLAAKVPQSLIDTRDRGADNRAGTIERVNVHRLPDVFHLHRIRADQKIAKVVDARHYGAGFPFQGSFTPADESLVCLKLHEHIRTIGIWCKRDAEYFQ